MNTVANNPPSASTIQTGSEGQRTLEQYVKVIAAVLVAILLTILFWKFAGDIAASLQVAFHELKWLKLRPPLFLGAVLVIWAGAVSYVGRVIGKDFRNLVFDRRNLTLAQLSLGGWALIEAGHILLKQAPESISGEMKEFGLPIFLILCLLVLRVIQGVYGNSGGTYGGFLASAGGGHGERREGGLFTVLFGVALVALIFAVSYRLFQAGAVRQAWAEQYRQQQIVAAAARHGEVAEPIVAIATNQNGLAVVEFLTNFAITAVAPSAPIPVSAHQAIRWGPVSVSPHLRVFQDGKEINSGRVSRRATPLASYTFQAKTNRLEGTAASRDIWVAVGRK